MKHVFIAGVLEGIASVTAGEEVVEGKTLRS